MSGSKTVGFDDTKKVIPEFDKCEEGHIQDHFMNKTIIIKDFVTNIEVGDNIATVIVTDDDKKYITFSGVLKTQLEERRKDYLDQGMLLKFKLVWETGKGGRYLTFIEP